MSARIVVTSDTHISLRGAALPAQFLHACFGADFIVHLGDFTLPDVLTQLRSLAPVYAVHGNNDDEMLVAILPLTTSFSVDDTTFVLIHGHVGGRTAVQAAKNAGSMVDGSVVVLFGHSHSPVSERVNEKLLFNPGSPTYRRWAPHRSFGIIDVNGELRPQIVQIE